MERMSKIKLDKKINFRKECIFKIPFNEKLIIARNRVCTENNGRSECSLLVVVISGDGRCSQCKLHVSENWLIF